MERRYDIDWLRVIAIGLLMVYHVAIVFQPWGLMIGFITNQQPWEALWRPMTMLNVWRIPLLFFISGIGVYFSFQNRTWQQLLKERATRIFIPFLFGIVVIIPLYVYILQHYYQWTPKYTPSSGHLWFLGNIFSYTVLALPVLSYLKKQENRLITIRIKKLMSSPWGLLLVISCFVVEVLLVKPFQFELYATTWHGFFLGLLAFLWGYCFALAGKSFWSMVAKYRWLLLMVAILFCALRLMQIELLPQNIHLPIESCLWIFSFFGLGYTYLNKTNKVLPYLSRAAYPVYIMHMIFIGLFSTLILPLSITVQFKFVIILLGTVAGSLFVYELIIKRIKYLRFLFGIKS